MRSPVRTIALLTGLNGQRVKTHRQSLADTCLPRTGHHWTVEGPTPPPQPTRPIACPSVTVQGWQAPHPLAGRWEASTALPRGGPLGPVILWHRAWSPLEAVWGLVGAVYAYREAARRIKPPKPGQWNPGPVKSDNTMSLETLP